MVKAYAIINKEGGWLVNTVMWDGSLETWQPPNGTHAVSVDEMNLNDLPARPSDI
jgi:hypothetical protein